MELLQHYLSLAAKSIFVENMILAYFLGMCSYLAVSKKIETSVGLGKAVIFVNGITVPLNWCINNYLLKEGALTWTGISGMEAIDLSFLHLIMFIATIAALVQLVEMIIEKFSASLYTSLGIFLPLITVNCAILGSSLLMNERSLTFTESTVYGFSSGLGWMLAIMTMAAIRQRLKYSDIPSGLKGLGITMILTGLISIAYLSFSGIQL